MPVRSPNIDELILGIHAAALEPDGWNRVGRELLSVLSVHSGVGLRVPSHAHPEPWAVLIDFDASAAAAYAAHWGRHDLWYQGAVRTGRVRTGLVSTGTQLTDPDEFAASEFFNDYLKALNIGPMIHVCLSGSDPADGFGQAALSLYRGIGQSDYSTDDVELLSRLAPHLTVAAKNFWRAESLDLVACARANALDSVSSAVFGMDAAGRVMFVNRLGQDLIRRERWVRISKGALAPVPTLFGADKLAAALRRVSTGMGGSLLVTDAQTGAQAKVSVSPISSDRDIRLGISAPASLVWIIPIETRKDTAQDLAKLFGLTPAELRILDKLIAGEDLRQAATALRVSIHTARGQLKSILRKTGRRSQGQLLMLAARLATITG
jgi:DNA-binding CsgD family transcriptional regulator